MRCAIQVNGDPPMKHTLALAILLLSSSLAFAQEPKVDQTWLDKVAGLKPKEQSEAIADKLRELNFKMPAAVTFKEEDGKITEFTFLGNGVRDVTPLVVLKHLKKL